MSTLRTLVVEVFMSPGHHCGVLDTYCAGRAARSASTRGFVLTGLVRDLEGKEYTANIN